MNVSQVMTPEVILASPEDTLEQAACIMDEHGVDALPICEHGRLIGMISHPDISLLVAAKEQLVKHTKLRYLMTAEVRYVFADQSIEYAAGYMDECKLRRLLVLSRDNRPVGMLSWGDLPLTAEHTALVASGVFQPC